MNIELRHAKEALTFESAPPAHQQDIERLVCGPVAVVPHSTVHELFEEQARRTPARVAIVQDQLSITYATLNARANRLARELLALDIRAGALVAVCAERGADMIVAVLATLKIGAAYVPLDPEYPRDRLRYILDDARPQAILTQKSLLAQLPPSSAAMAVVLDGDRAENKHGSGADLERPLRRPSSSAAYVIYTSGSTGQPKGTIIDHRSVLNLWVGLEQLYEATPCRRVALNASLNFDASVQQLVQLLSGRTLLLLSQNVRRDAGKLLAFLIDNQIESIDCTPSQMHAWIGQGLLQLRSQPLRLVLVGGEPIDESMWQLLGSYSQVRFYNVYGPTECTVDATCASLDGSSTPHIGRPMPNRRIYILNSLLKPVPVGATGEIYIGGLGVGMGYLHRSCMTSEKFLPDPFTEDLTARMYKTGDVGSWRADGAIEYRGRDDDQVKIRGHRIELGEIHSHLTRHPLVSSAAVVVREDVPRHKQLVAYVVLRDATHADIDTLRAHLRETLPEHMVPSAIVSLERIPLSLSGKLDRRSLPAPGVDAYARSGYEPPVGESETLLATVWESVLGISRAGRRDNFFELGGDSLRAVDVLESLRQHGRLLDIDELFRKPVLADMAAAMILALNDEAAQVPDGTSRREHAPTSNGPSLLPMDSEDMERLADQIPGGAGSIEDVYPLTPLQEGILFHHALDTRRSDPYVVPLLLSVDTRANLDSLVNALQSLIHRHGVLRTGIFWDRLSRPLQVVQRSAALVPDEIELEPNRSVSEQLEGWLASDRLRLDLRRAPPFRLSIAHDRSGKRWYALLQLHHILVDNVSLQRIFSELRELMDGLDANVIPSAPYRDHVTYVLGSSIQENAASFFRDKLRTFSEPSAPFAILNHHGDDGRSNEYNEVLPPEIAQRLRMQVRRIGVTAATLFHTAWALVVARTSGREDVVFGTVLLGRSGGGEHARRPLGLFINTLPLRIRLAGHTVSSLITQMRCELTELLSHEHASLATAQSCSGVDASTPLFSALINYRHGSETAGLDFEGAHGIRLLSIRNRTNYPLTLSVDDRGSTFILTVQAIEGIDASRVVGYVRSAVYSLIESLENDSSASVSTLDVLPQDERHRLIHSFNQTETSYPRGEALHVLFEAQVDATPQAIAVSYEETRLTYADLNAAANRFARYLMRRGTRLGDFIPVLMCRSVKLLIAQIAALKAGGVYVPIDPALPPERQAFLLSDCGARLAVVDSACPGALTGDTPERIDFDQALEAAAGESTQNLPLAGSPPPPAYVMYTSGSTGIPKGVVVPHESVLRLIFNNGYSDTTPDDCVAHYSNPTFDASTFEVWAPLLNGAKMAIVPTDSVLDARRFSDILRREKVTQIYMSVGLFNQYTESLADVLRNLTYLFVGGDAVDARSVQRVLRNSPPRRLLNVYAPTECTTFSTTYHIAHIAQDATGVPIGRPISNTQVYILDGSMQLAPLGVIGELYIGGVGVALGYLNRPELTAEKFVPDPFSRDSHARLYKTGDLARWREDGDIDFLGRSDHQVKVRGFRVELGEIESRLARHDRVKSVVVVARTHSADTSDPQKRLIAYVVPTPEARTLSAEELRQFLQAELPEYMIPSAFVLLESLPLTANGKVDKQKLPEPDRDAYEADAYVAPRGPTEQILSSIWQDLLAIPRIGRDDSFFRLGGHSLLALKALTRINERVGSDLRIIDIYHSSTIRELGERIEGASRRDELIDLSREAWLSDTVVAPPASDSRATGILLTGATGFVGRFLLTQLLHHTKADIYCLLQGRSPQEAGLRIKEVLAKWDLLEEQFEHRVIPVAGDLRAKRLGLARHAWNEMAERVDRIYHCAVSMNHLETYAMAKEANVGSARELIDFAAERRSKLVNYVSTLGVFNAHPSGSTRLVRENTPIDNEVHANSAGYTASKWVAEKIFSLAAQRGIPCNIFRLGLVWADSLQGRYDELQRSYRMLKTAYLSGLGIANYRHELQPTPVDYVARAVVSLADRHAQGQGIFHISLPRCESEQGLFEQCNALTGASLELLPLYDWICEIKRLHDHGQWLPALPLIEFAFSMSARTFEEHQRNARSLANVRFDVSQTQQKLAAAGVAAPASESSLVTTCVESMISRDAEVRSAMRGLADHRAHRRRDLPFRVQRGS